MSSTNKTANYQLSQFVGTDIPSILNDYNGDMRKIDSAIKEVSIAGGDNTSEIAGLRSTVSTHTSEISGLNSSVNSLNGRVISIEDKIPASASSTNKLVTVNDLPEVPSIETLEANVQDNRDDINEINKARARDFVSQNGSSFDENLSSAINSIMDAYESVHGKNYDAFRSIMVRTSFVIYSGGHKDCYRVSDISANGHAELICVSSHDGSDIRVRQIPIKWEASTGGSRDGSIFETVIATTGITRTNITSSFESGTVYAFCNGVEYAPIFPD